MPVTVNWVLNIEASEGAAVRPNVVLMTGPWRSHAAWVVAGVFNL